MNEVSLQSKGFFVGLAAFIVTTVALVLIGQKFAIYWLTFSYTYDNQAEGLYFTVEPVMPLILGFMMSMITEWIYIRNSSKKDSMHQS